MPPGVKGLAAMFEQRGDSNPADDRGRSPGPGMTRSLGGMYFVRILQLFSIVVLFPIPYSLLLPTSFPCHVGGRAYSFLFFVFRLPRFRPGINQIETKTRCKIKTNINS